MTLQKSNENKEKHGVMKKNQLKNQYTTILLFLLCLLLAGCQTKPKQAKLLMMQNENSPFKTAILAVPEGEEQLTVLLSDQCLGATLSVGDLDGDGTDEYVTNTCIGMNGGYGQYDSAVYKVSDGQLLQILSGDELEVDLTTSFAPEGKVIVSIDSLGYSKELQNVKTTCDSGEPFPQGEVFADSFYEFSVDTSTTPTHLVGKQYLWYAFHLNPAGELTTVWELKDGQILLVQATVEESLGN